MRRFVKGWILAFIFLVFPLQTTEQHYIAAGLTDVFEPDSRPNMNNVINQSYDDDDAIRSSNWGNKFRRRAKDSCPNLCRCFTLNNAFTADCQGKGLKGVPEGLDFGTKTLMLQSNPGIQLFPDRVFRERGAINIQVLSASRCSIHFIGAEAFHGLRFLRVLDLSRNALTTIPSAAFGDTPFLKKLILSNNPIRRIPTSSFAHCSRLQVLELDRCSIKWIEKGAFEGLYQLQSLKIKANALHSLNPDIFKPLIQLVFLDASGNSWICDCRMRAFKEWTLEQGSNKAFAMETLDISQSNDDSDSSPDALKYVIKSNNDASKKKFDHGGCSFPKYLKNRAWANIKLEELVCGPLLLDEVHPKILDYHDKGSYFPWKVTSVDIHQTFPNLSQNIDSQHQSSVENVATDAHRLEDPSENLLCDQNTGHRKMLQIECVATGYPPPKITWYFERHLIVSTMQKYTHVDQLRRLLPKFSVSETSYTMEPYWNFDSFENSPEIATKSNDQTSDVRPKDSAAHSFNYIFPSKIRHLSQDPTTPKPNDSFHHPNHKNPTASLRHSINKLDNSFYLWRTSENILGGPQDSQKTVSLTPSLIVDQIMLNSQAYHTAKRSTLTINCFDPDRDRGIYECIALGNSVDEETDLKSWPRKWYYVSPEAEIIPVSRNQIKYIQTLTSVSNKSKSLTNKRFPHQNKELIKALRIIKNTASLHPSEMSYDHRGSNNAWIESRKNGIFAPTNDNEFEKTASLQDMANSSTPTVYIVAIVGTSCIILFFVVFLICCLKFQRKFQGHINKSMVEKGSGGAKKKMKAKLKNKCSAKNDLNSSQIKQKTSGDEMENSMTSNHNGGFMDEPPTLADLNDNIDNSSYLRNGCLKQVKGDDELGGRSTERVKDKIKHTNYKGSHTLSSMINKSINKDKINEEHSLPELHGSRSMVGPLCKILATPQVTFNVEENEDSINNNPELINISSTPSPKCENYKAPDERVVQCDPYNNLSQCNLVYQPVDIIYPYSCYNTLSPSKDLIKDNQKNIVYTQILNEDERYATTASNQNVPLYYRSNEGYKGAIKPPNLTIKKVPSNNASSSSFATTAMTILEPENNAYTSISDFDPRLVQPLDLRELRSAVDRGSLFNVAVPPGAKEMSPSISYHSHKYKEIPKHITKPINEFEYIVKKSDYLSYYDNILSQSPTEVYSLDPCNQYILNHTSQNYPDWSTYQNNIDVSNDDTRTPNSTHIVLSERTTVV